MNNPGGDEESTSILPLLLGSENLHPRRIDGGLF